MAETNPARGTPEPTAAATVPAEVPATPASSLKATQDKFNEEVAKARTPAEINALVAKNKATMEATLRANPKGSKLDREGLPATEPKPKEPATAVEETPAATETPPEEAPAETPPETPEETDDPDDPDGGEGPISPVTGKRTHLRLAQDDKVGRLAASFMRRNRDMPMEQALDRARAQLGIKPQATPEPTPEAKPKSDLPETTEATETAIAELRAERRKAKSELRFEDEGEMTDKIENLLFHRLNLERQADKKQVEAASAYDQQFTASETRAAELYDFAGKPESEGGKRMVEIEADLKANGDPLYDSPDKPLRIAQMVAAELKIAPRRKGTPAAPAKAAAPANGTPVAKKQVLPGGESRTTPPPVNTPPAINAEISAVKTPYDLRNLRKKLGLPV